MAKSIKTLEYRRAFFLDGSHDLEQLVRQSWQTLETQTDREIISNDISTSALRSGDYDDRGFSIHCARYTDGQGVGIIPTEPATEVEVGEHPPPPNENFLSSDMMALFRGNHLICLNCGVNAGSLSSYLQQLFHKANFTEATYQFELLRIGNPDTIALIHEAGVKSVDLNVDIAEATAGELLEDDRDDGPIAGIASRVGNAIVAITGRDENLEQLQTAEKGTVKISINVPNRDVEAAKRGLDGVAVEVVQNEEIDGYVIHLRNGATIKPNEIAVRKRVGIDTMANSVDLSQAWNEMATFMDELEQSGQLRA